MNGAMSNGGLSVEKVVSAMVDDFVCDLMAMARQLAGISADDAAKLESAVRDRWGGDRPYIARRDEKRRSERNAAIRSDHQRGDAVTLLAQRYGLSRHTVWRVLAMGDTADRRHANKATLRPVVSDGRAPADGAASSITIPQPTASKASRRTSNRNR